MKVWIENRSIDWVRSESNYASHVSISLQSERIWSWYLLPTFSSIANFVKKKKSWFPFSPSFDWLDRTSIDLRWSDPFKFIDGFAKSSSWPVSLFIFRSTRLINRGLTQLKGFLFHYNWVGSTLCLFSSHLSTTPKWRRISLDGQPDMNYSASII